MEIYLAGWQSRPYVLGVTNEEKGWLFGDVNVNDIYLLESYYYISKQEWLFPLINQFKGFLLDSGAFTYMSGNGVNVNWDRYIEGYANFINTHNIGLFFELDIDVIVGIKEVERLRDKLEVLTNKKCIPVWHKSRGLMYFNEMCKNYDYVSIGGIVTKEIKPSEHSIFTNLINIAHLNSSKIHGLGYTNLAGLKKYKFDSVDSTYWIYGNRGGKIYKFNGSSISVINKPKGTKLNSKTVAANNFNEWVKFQKYAEKYL